MYRIAIVDEDMNSVNTALGYVRRYNEENGMAVQAAVFRRAEDFLTDYDGSFFAVFIDTDLSMMNGIGTARKLRMTDQSVSIIFTSRGPAHAVDGYDVSALAYLLKPVSYFTFVSKLEKARSIRDASMDLPVIISLKDRTEVIKTSGLYYVENDAHMVIYHTVRGNFRVRKTMAEVEEDLSDGSFACSGQSYLVNLRHVQTVEAHTVTVHGEKLPLSRAREKRFMRMLALYVERVRGGA
ncbi:MAG: LytTR family DNA-binding domain-containing protein [Clostridia bacterium]|nr:LytTR family DNA-binding domain-containing protein [Clostridia bacterium]